MDGYCDGSGVDGGVPGAEAEHATVRRRILYLESAIDLTNHVCNLICIVGIELIFTSMFRLIHGSRDEYPINTSVFRRFGYSIP